MTRELTSSEQDAATALCRAEWAAEDVNEPSSHGSRSNTLGYCERCAAAIVRHMDRPPQVEGAITDASPEPEPEAITDAERIDAIQRTVAATTDGVVIHDATPDWSVVVMNDGEVCGQGEDVRGALDKMVREDRLVRKVLGEHGVNPSPEMKE